jgi:hypothetical protein
MKILIITIIQIKTFRFSIKRFFAFIREYENSLPCKGLLDPVIICINTV